MCFLLQTGVLGDKRLNLLNIEYPISFSWKNIFREWSCSDPPSKLTRKFLNKNRIYRIKITERHKGWAAREHAVGNYIKWQFLSLQLNCFSQLLYFEFTLNMLFLKVLGIVFIERHKFCLTWNKAHLKWFKLVWITLCVHTLDL